MNDKKYTTHGNENELSFFKEVEDNLLAGKYNSSPEELEKKKKIYSKTASNTLEKLNKKKQYSIRLVESDVAKIKSMAQHKGLPYQVFISSILHQVATKQINI